MKAWPAAQVSMPNGAVARATFGLAWPGLQPLLLLPPHPPPRLPVAAPPTFYPPYSTRAHAPCRSLSMLCSCACQALTAPALLPSPALCPGPPVLVALFGAVRCGHCAATTTRQAHLLGGGGGLLPVRQAGGHGQPRRQREAVVHCQWPRGGSAEGRDGGGGRGGVCGRGGGGRRAGGWVDGLVDRGVLQQHWWPQRPRAVTVMPSLLQTGRTLLYMRQPLATHADPANAPLHC